MNLVDMSERYGIETFQTEEKFDGTYLEFTAGLKRRGQDGFVGKVRAGTRRLVTVFVEEFDNIEDAKNFVTAKESEIKSILSGLSKSEVDNWVINQYQSIK